MNPKCQAFMRGVIPLPQRVIVALMGFFGIINAYTMRICLSVAITRMVIHRETNGTNPDEHCPNVDMDTSPVVPGEDGPDLFDWSEQTQGLILSSFYWGYVLTHLPGGMIAEKLGGKYVLSLGILSTAIFTLLTPLVIRLGGANALIAMRFLEGAGEGTTFPALTMLLAMWTPVEERSRLGSLVFGGGQVGTILATLLSGYLIGVYKDWRVVFYFFGFLGVLWFIFFTFMCYSDPESHPYISDSEKVFLQEKIGQLKRDKDLPTTPWSAMLTNAPVIALIFAQIGHDFGFYIMVTDLPKYMNDILKFNITKNGLFSSLPYMFMWIVSISTGILADFLIRKKHMGITNSRKFYTTFASVVPSVAILGASYAGCNRVVVVILFVVAMGAMGTYYPGMKVNGLDLTPNYAASLMAVTNGIGALTGIIGPYMVGVLTPNRLLTEWRLVFWIAFGVFNITNIIYVIWASGEVQPFNDKRNTVKTTEL